MRNRSATDAIFVIKQVKENAIEDNTPAFICFVNRTKAFDKVKLGDVIRTLIKKRALPK